MIRILFVLTLHLTCTQGDSETLGSDSWRVTNRPVIILGELQTKNQQAKVNKPKRQVTQ